MKELSIIVDESGDFGSYKPHAPYYLFTPVFHEQKDSIQGRLPFLWLCSGSPPFSRVTRCAGLARGPHLGGTVT